LISLTSPGSIFCRVGSSSPRTLDIITLARFP
jgi:hypothetical protein